MKRVYLIGMPGSGKSVVGARLAVLLRLPFVDLDEEIEREAGMTVTQVFAEKGEAYFRELESRLLRSWAERPYAFVMATGGGAPCFHDGIDIINRSGASIFLDVPISALVARIAEEEHRPLIQGGDREEKLNALLQQRRPIYEKAQHTVVASGTPDDIAERILKWLESHPQG
ncbi:MAG: shikimate kinase [Bacteroidota bacterium]|jgi:shikimate kinase|nr:MAG: shikimate kinase [Bacteroidota bacterium]